MDCSSCLPTPREAMSFDAGDAVGDELRDTLDAPEVIQLDVLEHHRDAKLALQLDQELDEHHRIERGSLEQISVRRGHIHLQLVAEDSPDPGVQGTRVSHRGSPCAPTSTGRAGELRWSCVAPTFIGAGSCYP